MCVYIYIYLFILEMRILLCCPDWSQAPGLKQSSWLSFLSSWNCRHEPSYQLFLDSDLKLHNVNSQHYQHPCSPVLRKLVSNSCIILSQLFFTLDGYLNIPRSLSNLKIAPWVFKMFPSYSPAYTQTHTHTPICMYTNTHIYMYV